MTTFYEGWEGEVNIHGQALGIPMDFQQADAASVGAEIEEDIEYRCKNCECLLYEGCQQCLYCNLKNPLEVVQQVEGIQQVATLEELKETMLEFKNGSY